MKNKNSELKKARLVLSGGAALGLAEIGVIKVLEENFEITGVIGTSMGSLVGGLYAMGLSSSEILEFALNYKKRDIFKLFNLPKNLSGIFDGTAVLKQLETWTDNALIEDLRLPFEAVSYDLKKRKTVVIDKGPLANAMRASSSVPSIFAPFPWSGYTFVDGGVEHPLPLGLAHSLPGDITIAVNVLPMNLEEPERIVLSDLKHKPEKLSIPEVSIRSVTQNQAYMAMRAIVDNNPDLVIDAYYPGATMLGFDQAETFYHWGISRTHKALEEYEQPNYLERVRKKYQQIVSLLNQGL